MISEFYCYLELCYFSIIKFILLTIRFTTRERYLNRDIHFSNLPALSRFGICHMKHTTELNLLRLWERSIMKESRANSKVQNLNCAVDTKEIKVKRNSLNLMRSHPLAIDSPSHYIFKCKKCTNEKSFSLSCVSLCCNRGAVMINNNSMKSMPYRSRLHSFVASSLRLVLIDVAGGHFFCSLWFIIWINFNQHIFLSLCFLDLEQRQRIDYSRA